jgi:hypothetical protein
VPDKREKKVRNLLRRVSHLFHTSCLRSKRIADSHPTQERRIDMRKRLTRLGVALGLLAALAVGGSSLAGASQKSAPVKAPASKIVGAPDNDNVQQGDQSAPDNAAAGDPEQAGSESASEGAASESGPSDGPGGYADSSANADTQQQGEN